MYNILYQNSNPTKIILYLSAFHMLIFDLKDFRLICHLFDLLYSENMIVLLNHSWMILNF